MGPDETWARIAPLLRDFGVTRVADITGLDRIGLPVAIAVRPMSRSIAVAAGKGETLIAAKVSAAMEAIECAHAESIDLPLRFASRSEIGGAISPPFSRLPLLDGHAIDDETRLLWIEGFDLAEGSPVMVPYELVHAHYCPYGLPASGAFLATTNGLSSGNTLAEAVSHGLFEVIERDALNLWSRRPRSEWRRNLIALDLDDGQPARKALDRIERAGFRIAVWNITSDVGVPVFHCVIVDADNPDGHPGTGTGCHPDKHVALFRAISEAVQVRGVYISGGRDDLDRRDYETGHMRSYAALLDSQLSESPAHGFSEIPSSTAACFEDDLSSTAGRLSSVGCGQAMVVDLSRPGTGISVVRVIVPGLEGPFDDKARPGERARRFAG